MADARALATAMNYLYPAGVVHWHLNREGRLGLTSFRENAARQSGIYKRVQRLSGEGVQNAASACCEDAVCIKRTLWDVDETTPLGIHRGEGEIPCPEPCSIFVSFARRVRLFEREKQDSRARALRARGSGRPRRGRAPARARSPARPSREAAERERMRYRSLTLVPRLRKDGRVPSNYSKVILPPMTAACAS